MRIIGLRRGKRDRGAALVEMAIILPLLLTLFFGIIEMGWMLRCYLAVNQVAREGTRAAALNASTAEIQDRIETTATDTYNLTDIGSATVTMQYRTAERDTSGNWGAFPAWEDLGDSGTGNDAPIDADHYSQIRVTIVYPYSFLTGSLFSWLGSTNPDGTFPLGGRLVMRKEGEMTRP